jgi:4-oxalocrotonate tautomerase
MPLIRVEFLKGRTDEEKKKLIRALTDTYAQVMSSDPESIYVIIEEREWTDWALGGIPFSERP